MSKNFVQSKYRVGDVVCAKSAPKTKLEIQRYMNQVYYCKMQGDRSGREFIYRETEIVDDMGLTAKNRHSDMGQAED